MSPGIFAGSFLGSHDSHRYSAGIGIDPIGFLVTKGDQISFINTHQNKGLAAAFEKVPDLIEKFLRKKEAAADDTESGWTSLDVNEGVYNLLDLTNGLDTLLATAELPAGKISQIRLILGNNNNLLLDGTEHALATPSAQQAGLKLNLHAELQEGVTYTLLLDFDAARSIVRRGNGTYLLKPVIRSFGEATSGAIKGVVDPATSTPAIYAIQDQDTVATTFADSMGKFLMRGVPAGTYTVTIEPKEGYQAVVEEDVVVVLGSVTDLGTVSV